MEKMPVAKIAANLIALCPWQVAGRGWATQVFLRGNVSGYDPRQVRSLVAALARHYAIDVVLLRQRCRKLLHARSNLPLPLASQLVLVPLPLGQEGRLGYINFVALAGVEAGWLVLADQVRLECCLSPASLRNRLLRARLALLEMAGDGLLPWADQEGWQSKLVNGKGTRP